MTPIPVNTPALCDADRQSVVDCLESGWLSSEGPQVPRFEEAFAGAHGRQFGVAVSSGTAALDIAVSALGLRPGDEVLVPSLTIISCGRAVVQAGATLVPVDCDETDWNAHLRHFEARASHRTKAIVLVHLYGLCADLDPIVSWARARGLAIIEDVSQGLGLEYRGRLCGSFGDISVFSLYANKLVTTGEGGMILADSPAIAEKCRSLRNLCFDKARRFWHEQLGWNYRMTAMQAALGLPQVRRLESLVRRKREIGERYFHAFGHLGALALAPASTPYAANVYWVFALVVRRDARFDRRDVMDALERDRIGTRTFFYGLHQQPALVATGLLDAISLPVTESLSERGFYLPSGLGLSEDEQTRVIRSVTSLVSDPHESSQSIA